MRIDFQFTSVASLSDTSLGHPRLNSFASTLKFHENSKTQQQTTSFFQDIGRYFLSIFKWIQRVFCGCFMSTTNSTSETTNKDEEERLKGVVKDLNEEVLRLLLQGQSRNPEEFSQVLTSGLNDLVEGRKGTVDPQKKDVIVKNLVDQLPPLLNQFKDIPSDETDDFMKKAIEMQQPMMALLMPLLEQRGQGNLSETQFKIELRAGMEKMPAASSLTDNEKNEQVEMIMGFYANLLQGLQGMSTHLPPD